METIDFSRITAALSTPMGWLDLALALVSLVVAYFLSRRLLQDAQSMQGGTVKVGSGNALRVALPLLVPLLILMVRSIFHLYVPPFFLDIALALVVALVVIRLLVYVLQTTFKNAVWLKTSERAISYSVWFIVVLYFLGVLPQLIDELNTIVLPLGKGISLWGLLKGVVVLLITLSATLWVAGVIERQLLPKNISGSTSYNGRLLLARFLRAILLVVATLFALQSIGIDLTVFAVLGGAIGVGIGLGLQKLAANYIAGFAVLFEHSIKIGDMITVGDRFGVVREVTARYVVVRSLDGIDAMIPNETLLTQTVLNHSSSQREAHATLRVQVAYGTDLRLALRLIEQAAVAESRVMDGYLAPTATVVNFGDSGINLNLGFWIRDPQNGSGVLKSDINLRLWNLFIQNHISVPFPQREVRVLSVHEIPPYTQTKHGQ